MQSEVKQKHKKWAAYIQGK